MSESANDRVIALISGKQGIPRENISLDMSFFKLGIDGDDAVELIEALCDLFSINPTEIDLARYTIGPEGWGISLNSPPAQFISLKWAAPQPVDLFVRDLVQSAEQRRWFDPVSNPPMNW